MCYHLTTNAKNKSCFRPVPWNYMFNVQVPFAKSLYLRKVLFRRGVGVRQESLQREFKMQYMFLPEIFPSFTTREMKRNYLSSALLPIKKRGKKWNKIKWSNYYINNKSSSGFCNSIGRFKKCESANCVKIRSPKPGFAPAKIQKGFFER